jgi:hypothetical protein
MNFAISCAVQDGLHVERRIIDRERAGRYGDAERHEREGEVFLHDVPFVELSLDGGRPPSRERIYHQAKQARCSTRTRCGEVLQAGNEGTGKSVA